MLQSAVSLPALLYLLSVTAPHVPTSVLYKEIDPLLRLLQGPISNPHATTDAGTQGAQEGLAAQLRSVLGILEIVFVQFPLQVLTHTPLQQAFNSALKLCIDVRPKVRRRAQQLVLATLQRDDGDHPYASLVRSWLIESFDRVGEATGSKDDTKTEYDKKTGRALHSAASAALRQSALELKNEAKSRRGANVKLHPSAGVWLTGFAKELIPVLHHHGAFDTKAALEGLVKALIRLPSLQNPFLSVGAFDDFEVLFRQRFQSGSSDLLQTTIRSLRSKHVRNPVSTDAQLFPAYLHALASALAALARQDLVAGETGSPVSVMWTSDTDDISAMPIFRDVLTRALGAGLAAQEKPVREAGKALLLSIIKSIPKAKIISAAQNPKQPSEVKTIVDQLLGALDGNTINFLASRAELLGVVEGLVEQLRPFVPDGRSPLPQAHVHHQTPRAAEILCLPFLTAIAKMRSDEAFEHRGEADAVLAKAVNVCGPGVVLELLPLNLLGEVEEEDRAWLLPLMARQIENTELAHFAEVLLPLTKELDERRSDADSRRNGSKGPATAESLMWSTLIKQIWDLFPGYCKLPLDVVFALSETTLAADLVTALKRSQDPSSGWIRAGPPILSGLQQLVETSRSIKASGMGHEMEASFGLTPADGERNLEKLAEMAPGFMTVLYDVLRLSPREDQGFILPTMSLFIDLLGPQALEGAFQHLLDTLAQALAQPREGKQTSKDPSAPQSELATSLRVLGLFVPHLSVASASLLLTGLLGDATDKSSAKAPALLTDKAASVQKRAYNLVTRLVEASVGPAVLASNCPSGAPLLLILLKAITLSQAHVAPGAEDERMALLAALVPRIPRDQMHLLHPLTMEAVLGVKGRGDERKGSFSLLLALGEKFKAGGSINMEPLTGQAEVREANLEEYFLLASGLLGGSTAHEISATWMALSRLLYEYRRDISSQSIEELLQTAATFVKSQSREIIKASLGMMNVAAVGISTDLLSANDSALLRTVIESVFSLSKDNRYRFKLPVRHFCERLLRRFGYDAVARFVPEDDQKLLANIRKRKQRAKRRREEKEAPTEVTDTALGTTVAARKARDIGTDAFEDVLYGSEEELASSEDEEEEGASAKQKGKAPQTKKGAHPRHQGEEKMYLRADDDEPMNLLDRGAAGSKIMTGAGLSAAQARATTAAARANRRGGGGARFRSDVDTGKMLIEEEEEEGLSAHGGAPRGKKRKSGDDVEEEVDEDGAADAYAGLSLGADGHSHTRTGAVKFNKNTKKTRAAEAERDVDERDDHVRQIGAAAGEGKAEQRKRQKKEKTSIGAPFRAQKAQGDVQRGGLSPYAYVPLGAVSGKRAGGAARQLDITGHGRKRR